jgi:hypothetical protein
VGEAVLDVAVAVLVPEAVGAQGGRQVVVGLGEAVPVEVVLVAEGIGTQVVVEVGGVDEGAVDVGVVDGVG